jgi:hypothetical protein
MPKQLPYLGLLLNSMILGSDSSVDKDPSLMEYDDGHIFKEVLAPWMSLLPSSWSILKMEAASSSETLVPIC